MLIHNRKMLQAKCRRYSHVMQSFRVIAQKIAKQDAMIEWLAKACEELSLKLCECPEFQCPKKKNDWIKAAEKAVQDAGGM